jgi:hypothetical protein
MKSPNFYSAVSMTHCDKKLSLVNTHILCVKVIGIVQENLPMNVFSIDIPFKGSQSHSNLRSKVTAVSYLHSGVNDSAVPCAAKSDFLIKKQCVELFAKIFEKKVDCTVVSMTPLYCTCHSGVNDSAVHVTAVQPTLSIIFENSKPYPKRL